MRHWQPDLILLTGDVSEDGSPASYGRVSARLNTVGAPVLALPGNHDNPEVMQRFFPVGPWNGPHQQKERNWQLVLLDSTVTGEVSSVLTGHEPAPSSDSSALQQAEASVQTRPAEEIGCPT